MNGFFFFFGKQIKKEKKKAIKINSDINISAFQMDSANKEDVTFKVSLVDSLHIEVIGICLVLLLT